MPALKPNAKIIEQAVKGARERYTVEKHPGLYLYARGDGNASWMLRYRAVGKRAWHTLHSDAKNAVFADVVTAKDRWLADIALRGVDPKAEREAAVAAKLAAEKEARDTFGRLFNEWLVRHAKVRKKSWQADEILWNRHIKDRMDSLPAGAIKRADLSAILDDIADKATPIQANKCQAIISAVFAWAMNEGRVESTPAYRIPKRGKETPRERALTDDELRMLWKVALVGGTIGDAVRLLMLTGQRRAEVAEMPRAELDISKDDPTWIIPGARTKNKIIHRVPLSPAALGLLRSRILDDNAFAFAGRADSSTGAISPDAVTRFLWKQAIGSPSATVHDIRRTVGTRMAAMGVPKDIRSKVLNHITGARSSVTDSVYNQYDGSAEKRRALELWANRLAEIIEGKPPSGARW